MEINRKLSPLEKVLLGNVWRRGGCTAYSLVAMLRKSKSAYYRSGAGSVYPAMKRLAKAGYLLREDSGATTDSRYSITESGIEALRQWFAPPFEEADFMCSLDLLRSRIYFLDLLPESDRILCLERLLIGLKALEGQIELIVAGHRDAGENFDELAATGALYETRARVEWVKFMRAKLENGAGS